MSRWPFVLVLSALVGAACSTPEPAPKQSTSDSVPPGLALPEAVDAFFYGDATRCTLGSDCQSGACYYGTCTGLLVIDQRWLQEEIGQRLRTYLTDRPNQRGRAIEHLKLLSERPGSDIALKGRAVLALEQLETHHVLIPLLNHPSEALAAAAAMALTRMGRDEGLEMTAALTESTQDALAVEALQSLGRHGGPEGLVPLLRALNPSLDGVVLTAALGGLEALNDQRAVHVLVDWLKRAPDYLKLDTVKVLRALTGQTMGPEVPAWTTWIATAKIPKPPTFEPRDHNPHIELGLPTP